MSKGRPASLAEVANRHLAGEPFDPLLREFLDAFYSGSPESRPGRLDAEPPSIAGVHDAYLAAVGEHLARRFGLPIPAWTEGPERFLRVPFFAGGLESLKAVLLAESPLAFRRRQLFVSRNALSRPRELAGGR